MSGALRHRQFRTSRRAREFEPDRGARRIASAARNPGYAAIPALPPLGHRRSASAFSREVHLEECARRAVETARRMTGGGAIYMGPGLLGWELVVDRARTPGPLEHISRTLCTGLASGLSRLGIEARYRPQRRRSARPQDFRHRGLHRRTEPRVPGHGTDRLRRRRYGRGVAAAGRQARQERPVGTCATGHEPDTTAGQRAGASYGEASGLGRTAKALDMEPQPGALSQQEEDLGARYYNKEIGTDTFVKVRTCPPPARQWLRATQRAVVSSRPRCACARAPTL